MCIGRTNALNAVQCHKFRKRAGATERRLKLKERTTSFCRSITSRGHRDRGAGMQGCAYLVPRPMSQLSEGSAYSRYGALKHVSEFHSSCVTEP